MRKETRGGAVVQIICHQHRASILARTLNIQCESFIQDFLRLFRSNFFLVFLSLLFFMYNFFSGNLTRARR
jgi:hypothetical protein